MSERQRRARFTTRFFTRTSQRAIAEFDTLKAAMFTEPDDQSVWFYHRWAVRQGADLAASDASRASDWESHLHEQRKTLEELVAVAPESKCP